MEHARPWKCAIAIKYWPRQEDHLLLNPIHHHKWLIADLIAPKVVGPWTRMFHVGRASR